MSYGVVLPKGSTVTKDYKMMTLYVTVKHLYTVCFLLVSSALLQTTDKVGLLAFPIDINVLY